MTMHNPEAYQKYISFQKRDADEILEKNKNNLSWKGKASILDIGSGDGLITTEILKKHIPKDFKELIGTDISEKMVDFANNKYKDGRISFLKMDAAGIVPEELKGRFDHAFSSSVFQFVYDQETAFKNLYEMLVEGGSFIIGFPATIPIYDLFINMSQMEKWRPWAEGKMKFCVSRYHYVDDPVAEAKKIVQAAGFKDVHVECTEKSYVYDKVDDFLSMLIAANVWQVPQELLEDLKKDYKKILFEKNLVDRVKDSDGIGFKYQRMEIFGRKQGASNGL